MLSILGVLIFSVSAVAVIWVICGSLIPALPRMIELLTLGSSAYPSQVYSQSNQKPMLADFPPYQRIGKTNH